MIAMGIVSIGGALKYFINLLNVVKKPDKKRDESIEKIEAIIDSHSDKLESDNKRLDQLEKATNLLLKSQMALLDHALDGNNTERMTDAKDEIQQYLIDRK